MKTLPRHPVIYVINTWVWLGELGRKFRKSVDLDLGSLICHLFQVRAV